MDDKKRQYELLKMLCQVCDDIFEIWKESTKIDDKEIRRLIMRETAGSFYNLDMLIRQLDVIVNEEEAVFHA